jgi:GxxExxY protein
LARELVNAGLTVRQEVAIPVVYKAAILDCGFRADLLVEEVMLVELKAVDQLAPIHEAQLLTHLKLSGLRLGLLINLNVRALKDGIRRLVN